MAGGWLLAASGAVGCLISLIAYFREASGISHTPGALIVIISTALIVLAALGRMGWRSAPGWVPALLTICLLLDVLGTGVAAWFLHAWALLAVDVLCALGWLMLVSPRHGRSGAPA